MHGIEVNTVNKYILNGLTMVSRQRAHDEIAQVLCLPDYYGRNLDALWDCASTMEAEVILTDSIAMLDMLGNYGQQLIATLQEAAQKNPGFHLEIRP